MYYPLVWHFLKRDSCNGGLGKIQLVAHRLQLLAGCRLGWLKISDGWHRLGRRFWMTGFGSEDRIWRKVVHLQLTVWGLQSCCRFQLESIDKNYRLDGLTPFFNTFNTSNASSRWIWRASWSARHWLWRVRLHPFAPSCGNTCVQVAGWWIWDEAEKGHVFFGRCDGVTLTFPPQNAVDQLHDWIYVYRGFEGNLSRNTVIDYALSNTDSCHCRRVQPWSAKGVHWPEGRATTAAPEWVLQTCG